MKFSHDWLKEYLKCDISIDHTVNKFNNSGLEVNQIEPVSGDFSGVVIGEIEHIEKHPQADRLNICSVNIGDFSPLVIVCGANNIYEGVRVPVALIGATLPGDFEIRKSKLRGQYSYGMMCSARELGLSSNADGLLELPKNAPIGQSIREYLDLNDVTIDIDLTPNRADCLSIYGLAREIAALSERKLKSLDLIVHDSQHEDYLNIHIAEPDVCKRYFGVLIKNINNKINTPIYITERLRRSNIEPRTLIVDITNYILLLTGQPMHAFDAQNISQNVTVRYANDKEKITLLDNREVTLSSDTLVISDNNSAIALAGIMGGLYSSVNEDTTEIFLESAFFEPDHIAGKARRYGLHTESSHRFERGVDPDFTKNALHMAIDLIVNLAEGKIGPISEHVSHREPNPIIELKIEKLNRVTGMNFTAEVAVNTLTSLGMTVEKARQDVLHVQAPSYRFDINICEDLIEEVIRLYGYENIIESHPAQQLNITKITKSKTQSKIIVDTLINRGYNQAINYSFIDETSDKIFFKNHGIKLKNPISSDMSIMRQSLIPGLIKSFKENFNRQQLRVRLFELGVVFQPVNNHANEKEYLAGLCFGHVNSIHWSNNKLIDFYDVKKDICVLLKALNVDVSLVSWKKSKNISWLHPGQSADIYLNGNIIGCLGVIHPSALKSLSIKAKSPIVFELYLNSIIEQSLVKYQNISKFPSVARDLSFVVGKDIMSSTLIDSIKSLNMYCLKEICVFDVYQGDNLPADKKSIALNLLFQDDSKTLTDEAISTMIDCIIEKTHDEISAIIRY